MNNKKIIIVGSIVLIILIVTYTLITRGGEERNKIPNTLSPTPIERDLSKQDIEQNAKTASGFMTEAFNRLTPVERNALVNVRRSLPQNTATFSMIYSARLEQYFVRIKSPQGYTDLKNFLRANELLTIYNKGYIGITVTESTGETSLKELEDEFLLNMETGEREADH